MNAERMLALYDRVSDAPDAVARLRRFVLDLAVRGKLVEQDPEDEHASVLLERIAAEKARLVQAGKMKKPKVSATIDPSELPINVPSHWTWSRLCDIGRLSGGMTPSKSNSEYWNGNVVWVSPKDIKTDEVRGSELKITDAGLRETRLELYPEGSLFIVARSGILKRTFPVSINRVPAASNQDLKVLVPFLKGQEQYLQIMFRGMTDFLLARLVKQGTTVQSLRYAEFAVQPFPLPPLAEQHRIVARVEELMALLDRLEAARDVREATRDRLTVASLVRLTAPDTTAEDITAHASFALDALPVITTDTDQVKLLRQTILSLAVQGKLTEQDSADEPASELLKRLRTAQKSAFTAEGLRQRKAVHRLSRSELWFTFPPSWELSCFDDLFVVASGVTKGGRVSADLAIELPYLRVANVQRGHLDLTVVKKIVIKKSNEERYRLRDGDILMTEGGDWDKLGRAAIWRDEISGCIHQNHVFRVRPPSQEIRPEWVVVYVNSKIGRRFFEEASKQTTNLASINMTQLRSCPLLLPPLAEQHRIVAKVDALMALCDRLDSVLRNADATRARLLDTLLHEALSPAALDARKTAA